MAGQTGLPAAQGAWSVWVWGFFCPRGQVLSSCHQAGAAGLAEQGRAVWAVPSVGGWGMPLLAGCGLRAVLAHTFHLDRCALHGKVFFVTNGFQYVQNPGGIRYFGYTTAGSADQELGTMQAGFGLGMCMGMLMLEMRAGDKGGQAFNAMDQSVFEQKVEGAVYGRGGWFAPGCFELL